MGTNECMKPSSVVSPHAIPLVDVTTSWGAARPRDVVYLESGKPIGEVVSVDVAVGSLDGMIETRTVIEEKKRYDDTTADERPDEWGKYDRCVLCGTQALVGNEFCAKCRAEWNGRHLDRCRCNTPMCVGELRCRWCVRDFNMDVAEKLIREDRDCFHGFLWWMALASVATLMAAMVVGGVFNG